MNVASIYAVAGVLIFAFSLYAMIAHRDLIRRVIAANVMGSGVFLFLVAMAARDPRASPDPVPHAMVLTGVVVAISATALGLSLTRHLHAVSGKTRLPEDR